MEPLIRPTSVPDGLFWLLLVGLGLSVAARYRDPNRWVLFTALAMNNKYLMVFNRGKLWRQPFFWIMNLAFWAQSTAFLWVHWTHLGLGPQAPELWWLFAGVGMGLSVKIGAQKITAELNCSSVSSWKVELSKFWRIGPVSGGGYGILFFLV